MMTLSKALTSGQVTSYFEKEYSNGADNYYSEGDTIKGEWFGELADEWGLKGEVNKEQFGRLAEGQHPISGEQSIRKVKSYIYTNNFGEEKKSKGHRAAFDATFNAPKSVSLAALVGGDDRIRELHREAVKIATKETEKYIQAKMGNTNPSITTGKMIAAMFEHDTARPDKESGYASPHLHGHTIIFNMTELIGGKCRALDSTELFNSQKYATAIYRAVLAFGLPKLGYEIEVDGKTGAPEINGFTKEYLEANSTRSKELREYAKVLKSELEEKGYAMNDGAGLRQAAASANKESKKFDRAEMLERHQEKEREYGNQSHDVVEKAIKRGAIEYSMEEISKRAQEAVTFGISRLMDPEAVGDKRDLVTHSLRRNMGLTTFDAVKEQIDSRERQGTLIGILRPNKMPEVTTRKVLSLENTNVKNVLEGKGTQEPIVDPSKIDQLISDSSKRNGITLTDSQANAIKTLLTNHDRIVGLQGGAGTGKSTVLADVRQGAEEAGYKVSGFAPSTPARRELAKSGIETNTLQKFIYSKRPETQEECKRLFVLDESSLASTEQVYKFFERIGPNDRVILVGDIKQHLAIDAGSPFEQFQKNGMGTSILDKIVRQKDEALRRVVEKLSERKVKDAVKDLISQGRVVEILDDNERLRAIASDYCSNRENTLVISPGNEGRAYINAAVHGQLQDMGFVDKAEHQVSVLINRSDMTGTERTFAKAYNEGDVIRFNRSSSGIKLGDYAQVVKHDYKENTLTVKLRDGEELTYDPRRLYGVSVYVNGTRDFAVGDRIQFRAPYAEGQVVNGEMGIIKDISDKTLKIELDSKQIVEINNEKFKHFDYGYAVTSYSSQCATYERVILHADTKESKELLNQRTGYVGISRARQDARVYTDSVEKLADALNRKVDKEIAIDAVKQNRLTNSHHYNANDKSVSTLKANESQNITKASSTLEQPQSRSSNITATQTSNDEPRTFKKTVTEYQFEKWEKSAPQQLIRVKKSSPCPVCEKTNWCSVSTDKSIAICMRTSSEYETKNGGYVHVLDGVNRNITPLPVSIEVTQNTRASIDQRDNVYGELLNSLYLKDRDKRDLVSRGLDGHAIERYEYKSVPSSMASHNVAEKFKDQDLTGIPGFYKDSESTYWKLNVNDWHSGYLIPVRSVEGQIEGFQIRRANAESKDDRYIWLSSSNKEQGASSGSPIHFRNPERVDETHQVIITEGALKADIASHLLQDQHCVVSVQGVGNFPEHFGQLLRDQLPALQQVVIAFDADYSHNPNVQHQLERLTETLKGAGLDVKDLKWEESKGKGIDDYLLSDTSHQQSISDYLNGIREENTITQVEQHIPKVDQKTNSDFRIGLSL